MILNRWMVYLLRSIGFAESIPAMRKRQEKVRVNFWYIDLYNIILSINKVLSEVVKLIVFGGCKKMPEQVVWIIICQKAPD